MSEPKWTRGPYLIAGNTYVYALGPDGTNRMSAQLTRYRGVPDEEVEATARLFATAAQLYDALEFLNGKLELFAETSHISEALSMASACARAVLEKARGEVTP